MEDEKSQIDQVVSGTLSDGTNVDHGDTDGDTGFPARLRAVMGKDGPYIWAKRLNVSANAIQKWLSGQTEPGMKNLVTLAEIGRVQIDWLATGRGPIRAKVGDAEDPAVSEAAIEAPEADPKLVRRLTREFIKVYKGLGIAVDQLDVVEMATEEHNRIRRHAAAGQALDAVVGYAVDQLRQRLLQANDEAASRKRPA
ncbi:MAG: helix-turn-helix transcriptional regulator [Alphaproteobacteria bacterium]|nr:helix-turn-helix transcriptional regulator [Alphaproteobacteria bacterium]